MHATVCPSHKRGACGTAALGTLRGTPAPVAREGGTHETHDTSCTTRNCNAALACERQHPSTHTDTTPGVPPPPVPVTRRAFVAAWGSATVSCGAVARGGEVRAGSKALYVGKLPIPPT